MNIEKSNLISNEVALSIIQDKIKAATMADLEAALQSLNLTTDAIRTDSIAMIAEEIATEMKASSALAKSNGSQVTTVEPEKIKAKKSRKAKQVQEDFNNISVGELAWKSIQPQHDEAVAAIQAHASEILLQSLLTSYISEAADMVEAGQMILNETSHASGVTLTPQTQSWKDEMMAKYKL